MQQPTTTPPPELGGLDAAEAARRLAVDGYNELPQDSHHAAGLRYVALDDVRETLLVGWPLMLYPVHVVFLELVIDPACSLVFEGEDEEADIMRRPPRQSAQRLVDRPTLLRSLGQGLAASAAVLVIYAWAMSRYPPDLARTLGFTTLVAANLSLIVLNRSRTRSWLANLLAPNPALRVVLGGAGLLYAGALSVPWLRSLFLFAPADPGLLLLALAVGICAVVALVPFTRRHAAL